MRRGGIAVAGPAQFLVVARQRAHQPARVHAHHHHEQREGQQQVHRLEHLHHRAGGAAVQVVDVEDDPLHRHHALRLRLAGAQLLGQGLEIASHRGHQAQVLPVVRRAGALGEEPGQALAVAQFVDAGVELLGPLRGLAHALGGGALLGLEATHRRLQRLLVLAHIFTLACDHLVDLRLRRLQHVQAAGDGLDTLVPPGQQRSQHRAGLHQQGDPRLQAVAVDMQQLRQPGQGGESGQRDEHVGQQPAILHHHRQQRRRAVRQRGGADAGAPQVGQRRHGVGQAQRAGRILYLRPQLRFATEQGDQVVRSQPGESDLRRGAIALQARQLGGLGLALRTCLRVRELGGLDRAACAVELRQQRGLLRGRTGARRHMGRELLEDVGDEAGPEVGVDVVPGVELHLHDVLAEARLRTLAARPLGQALRRLLHLVHEEALARAPVAEQADRQRRLQVARHRDRGERLRLGRDAQRVDLVLDRIGGVAGHGQRVVDRGRGRETSRGVGIRPRRGRIRHGRGGRRRHVARDRGGVLQRLQQGIEGRLGGRIVLGGGFQPDAHRLDARVGEQQGPRRGDDLRVVEGVEDLEGVGPLVRAAQLLHENRGQPRHRHDAQHAQGLLARLLGVVLQHGAQRQLAVGAAQRLRATEQQGNVPARLPRR